MKVPLDDARAIFASGDEEARREAVARLSDAGGGEALQFLVAAMGDDSWRVRKEAAARASGWDDREAAARALTEALAEPDNVGRRNAAVEGLTQLGQVAVAPLVEALASRPEHRKLLVDTLGAIGDTRAAEAVAPVVDDEDANVRVAAAEALGQLGGPVALAALRRALARGERLLTVAALESLGRAGARLTASEIAPMLNDHALRPAAFAALGHSGELAAVAPLSAGLGDPARSVREAATRALARLVESLPWGTLRDQLTVEESAMQPLVTALLEGTPPVQRAAATVLGLSGRASAVRPLAIALDDPELKPAARAGLEALGGLAVPEIVRLAEEMEPRLRADLLALLPTLGAEGHAGARALLEESLNDEDTDAAAAAAGALGAIGTRETLPSLVRALEREPEVAHAAADALGQLGKKYYDDVRILVASRGLDGADAPYLCRVIGACGREGDAALLRQALRAEEAALRRAAADALGELPAEAVRAEADEALVFGLADESAEVRAAAARALGAHARTIALDPLERAVNDTEAPVRAAAAHAIGQVAARAAPESEARARGLAFLRRLADLADAVVAAPALEALGAIGAAEDEKRLVRALDRLDDEVVKAAARGLGDRATSSEGRAALERALVDRRWDVRRAAAEALGAQGKAAHATLSARRAVETDALVLEAIEAALSRTLEGR